MLQIRIIGQSYTFRLLTVILRILFGKNDQIKLKEIN